MPAAPPHPARITDRRTRRATRQPFYRGPKVPPASLPAPVAPLTACRTNTPNTVRCCACESGGSVDRPCSSAAPAPDRHTRRRQTARTTPSHACTPAEAPPVTVTDEHIAAPPANASATAIAALHRHHRTLARRERAPPQRPPRDLSTTLPRAPPLSPRSRCTQHRRPPAPPHGPVSPRTQITFQPRSRKIVPRRPPAAPTSARRSAPRAAGPAQRSSTARPAWHHLRRRPGAPSTVSVAATSPHPATSRPRIFRTRPAPYAARARDAPTGVGPGNHGPCLPSNGDRAPPDRLRHAPTRTRRPPEAHPAPIRAIRPALTGHVRSSLSTPSPGHSPAARPRLSDAVDCSACDSSTRQSGRASGPALGWRRAYLPGGWPLRRTAATGQRSALRRASRPHPPTHIVGTLRAPGQAPDGTPRAGATPTLEFTAPRRRNDDRLGHVPIDPRSTDRSTARPPLWTTPSSAGP